MTLGPDTPDDAGHVALAKRHAHQGARRERSLTSVVQAGSQTRMLGRFDRDAQRH